MTKKSMRATFTSRAPARFPEWQAFTLAPKGFFKITGPIEGAPWHNLSLKSWTTKPEQMAWWISKLDVFQVAVNH